MKFVDCFRQFPFRREHKAQLIAGDPAVRISRQCGPGKRPQIRKCPAVFPGKDRQHRQDRDTQGDAREPRDQPPPLLEPHTTCGKQCDDAHARKVLEMIGHEGIPLIREREDTEKRRKCADEKK